MKFKVGTIVMSTKPDLVNPLQWKIVSIDYDAKRYKAVCVNSIRDVTYLSEDFLNRNLFDDVDIIQSPLYQALKEEN